MDMVIHVMVNRKEVPSLIRLYLTSKHLQSVINIELLSMDFASYVRAHHHDIIRLRIYYGDELARHHDILRDYRKGLRYCLENQYKVLLGQLLGKHVIENVLDSTKLGLLDNTIDAIYEYPDEQQLINVLPGFEKCFPSTGKSSFILLVVYLQDNSKDTFIIDKFLSLRLSGDKLGRCIINTEEDLADN